MKTEIRQIPQKLAARLKFDVLTILLCKGTCALVAPPFKRQGGSAPVMHPCSGVPSRW